MRNLPPRKSSQATRVKRKKPLEARGNLNESTRAFFFLLWYTKTGDRVFFLLHTMYSMMWETNYNPMGYGFGFFFMMLFWLAVIVAIAVFIKWAVQQGGNGEKKGQAPLDIVKERYARGEINKKEFEEKKRDLA